MIDDLKMVRWIFELPWLSSRLDKVIDVTAVAASLRHLWDIYDSKTAPGHGSRPCFYDRVLGWSFLTIRFLSTTIRRANTRFGNMASYHCGYG